MSQTLEWLERDVEDEVVWNPTSVWWEPCVALGVVGPADHAAKRSSSYRKVERRRDRRLPVRMQDTPSRSFRVL